MTSILQTDMDLLSRQHHATRSQDHTCRPSRVLSRATLLDHGLKLLFLRLVHPSPPNPKLDPTTPHHQVTTLSISTGLLSCRLSAVTSPAVLIPDFQGLIPDSQASAPPLSPPTRIDSLWYEASTSQHCLHHTASQDKDSCRLPRTRRCSISPSPSPSLKQNLAHNRTLACNCILCWVRCLTQTGTTATPRAELYMAEELAGKQDF